MTRWEELEAAVAAAEADRDDVLAQGLALGKQEEAVRAAAERYGLTVELRTALDTVARYDSAAFQGPRNSAAEQRAREGEDALTAAKAGLVNGEPADAIRANLEAAAGHFAAALALRTSGGQ
jgi:hypothetical protein